MHGAMATKSFLHNGTVFLNKPPYFKVDTHKVESTNLLSPTVNYVVTNGLTCLSYPSGKRMNVSDVELSTYSLT